MDKKGYYEVAREIKNICAASNYNIENKNEGTLINNAEEIMECLKMIITDKAECSFSWFGHHGNIPVHSLTAMNIIKECASEKYPSSRVSDTINIIKKWFQYAKDRQRKSISKTAAN